MIETRTINAQGVLLLPKLFANSTVTIEYISDNEIRVCRPELDPQNDFPFAEENRLPLSDRDRDLVLELIENPPEPTPELLIALERNRARNG